MSLNTATSPPVLPIITIIAAYFGHSQKIF